MLEYLGFQIEESDIERANRVGGGRDDDGKGPRAIGTYYTFYTRHIKHILVMELISERLKHSILREAAVKLRYDRFSKEIVDTDFDLDIHRTQYWTMKHLL